MFLVQNNKYHPLTRFISAFCVLVFFASFVVNTHASTYLPSTPSITASAAIVIEASTGKVLYSKNPDQLMYHASLTKVMTAYIIFEEIQAGNLTLQTPITITPEQATLSRSSIFSAYVPLNSGSVHTVETMLKLMLLPSASAACVIMAENISGSEWAFVQRMNATAARLGIDATYTNTYSTVNEKLSPRAQARLIQQFVTQFPEVLNITTQTSVYADGRTYTATNKLILPSSGYYYEGVQGFKTGTNTVVGSNLSTTAVRGDERIITVVCGSSSDANRYNDTIKLLDYGFDSLSYQNQLSYFHDTVEYDQCHELYERFRQLGVNLQSVNGWVRPSELMTLGEFATTFVSALEELGVFEKVDPVPDIPEWSDYVYRDVLYRGYSYGILPEMLYTESPLTQGYVDYILDNALTILGGYFEEESVPEYTPEEESVPEYTPEEEDVPEYTPEEESVPEYAPEEESVPEYAPEEESVPEYTPEEEYVPEYTPEEESVPEYTPEETGPSYSEENPYSVENPLVIPAVTVSAVSVESEMAVAVARLGEEVLESEESTDIDSIMLEEVDVLSVEEVDVLFLEEMDVFLEYLEEYLDNPEYIEDSKYMEEIQEILEQETLSSEEVSKIARGYGLMQIYWFLRGQQLMY